LISWECYEASPNSLLAKRIKAPRGLVSSIRPQRINFRPHTGALCGNDYTERDSDPQHANVQFAIVDAQLVQLGDIQGHLPLLSHHSPLSLWPPVTGDAELGRDTDS